ncbi:MAG: SDR family oxidoreductase [Gammaproteobacteria bacterium]|jgi:NAD(P)-dependent dehydrogenase (short-subunit alcohol dehydrogenase family)|nr:SDR family oxidoreductase [Gammaproteobacteria bacterium]
MSDQDRNDPFKQLLQGGLDRRDLLAGAAGIAATLFGAQQAQAGAHRTSLVELSEEDKIAQPVGEGAQILVTGANRGLGLEFTRQYAARGAKVIATARSPERADELNALAAANRNIVVEQLDVTDHAAIEALGAKYVDTPIDLLLNNAGIGGGIENQFFGKMNYATFDEVMDVNVKGPMKMCEVFQKQVQASNLRKMVAVSSSQGSIASVRSPLLYWYRASKSALNMCMVNLAYQLQRKRVMVGLVTPGATATDFIPEQFRKAIEGIQTPEEATTDMIRNIDRFSLANTGTFFDYTGEIVPW